MKLAWTHILASCLMLGCIADRTGLAPAQDAGVETDSARDSDTVDAPIDATADVLLPDDAGRCADQETRCASDTLLERCIEGDWLGYTCDLGCDVGVGRCAGFPASNGLGPISQWAYAAGIEVSGGDPHVADCDTGQITVRRAGAPDEVVREVRSAGVGFVGGVGFEVIEADGRSIGVFSSASLRVALDASLFVVGTNPCAFRVSGPVELGGLVSLKGWGGAPGAGSRSSDLGNGVDGTAGPVTASGSFDSGGGGGGHFTSGAVGGNAPGGTLGGAGGTVGGSSNLVPLRGGGRGGEGGGEGGVGGAGGGALQLSAATTLTVSGTIDAAGGGGAGGSDASDGSGGGGGGGAGGAILLESPMVSISVPGLLLVAGGAGGQGTTCENVCMGSSRGMDGADGGSVVPAPGPAGLATGGGGGSGSDADGVPRIGGTGTNGGGGGGGAGRVRINTASGAESFLGVVVPNVGLSVGRLGDS